MSKHHSILSVTGLVLSLVPVFNTALAQSTPPKIAQPTAVVDAFYRWYLHLLSQNFEPVTQDKAAMRKYVATSTMNEIDKLLKSPDGLDSDYFLQTQDYLDEWKSSISVTRLENNGVIATTLLSLGGKDKPAYKLKVSLKLEAGAWKITKVQSLRH